MKALNLEELERRVVNLIDGSEIVSKYEADVEDLDAKIFRYHKYYYEEWRLRYDSYLTYSRYLMLQLHKFSKEDCEKFMNENVYPVICEMGERQRNIFLKFIEFYSHDDSLLVAYKNPEYI